MKSIRYILLMAALGGAALVAGLIANSIMARPSARPAYTLVWQVTDFGPDGRQIVRFTESGYQASDGRYRSVREYADGRVVERYFDPSAGAFMIDRDAGVLRRTGKWSAPVVTREQLLRSEQFSRLDVLMGHEAVVVVAGADEFYRLPALGGDVARIVVRDPKDGSVLQVWEPVQITLGEPDAALVRRPDLPVIK